MDCMCYMLFTHSFVQAKILHISKTLRFSSYHYSIALVDVVAFSLKQTEAGLVGMRSSTGQCDLDVFKFVQGHNAVTISH